MKKGIYFLIMSAVFLLISFNPTLTSGVIGANTEISSSYLISIIFFLVSSLIFASRQTLDTIMIPTGPSYKIDRERTDRAVQEDEAVQREEGEESNQIYLISGRIDEPVKTSQVYEIYKRLRDSGIKPKEMVVEGKSANTLENIYSR